ncbi:MAG: TldD/PmbA family protein [Clostridiales bacterium]|jgi:TldD protein|nr:TldD/PmbA family protein [Clostridiales bacterium]
MLSKLTIENIMAEAMTKGADFSEVYCDDNRTTAVQLNGGSVEYGAQTRDLGVGIRVFKGLNNAYAFTNDMSEDSLVNLAGKTASMLGSKESGKAKGLGSLTSYKENNILNLPTDVEYGRKIDLLKHIDSYGIKYDKRIKKINVNYYDCLQNVLIANSDGLYVEDTRVKTRIRVSALADDGKNVYMGHIGPGAMAGYEYYEGLDLKWYAEEACRMAIAMLEAKYAPAGNMSVIVDNGFGGLLFHEACGHSLEASSVSKGASEFSGRLNETVASPILTLIDDGSLPNRWGSLHVDDEGTKTQKNVLIGNGVLKGYLVDKLSARRMNTVSTGSGRRQSYRFAPTSRMTNTYIAPGASSRDDIIKNTERGIFVRYINAGSVNPVNGEFNFSTTESYMVENGKITYPVKGATLIGTGGEILKKVDMIADNMDIGDGFCFAGSGSLFICAGQPTVRVSSMTIGGTGND